MQNVETRVPAHSAFGIWHYGVALLALAFLLLHLPFLPDSLEDLDSINFALALRAFNVAHHQPHPPGYPIYVGVGRIAHAFVPSEAKALSLVGVIAGALSAIALAVVFARLNAASRRLSFLAALLTVTAPLYWFTAVRPLSDAAGLAAALGVQAVTLSVATGPLLMLAAFLGGLATGVRSQVAWLTAPLLLLALARSSGQHRTRLAGRVAVGFAAGSLAWMIPLVALSGGPGAYWQALFSQGAEDLSGVRMLWTTPTARQLVFALKSAFIDPWAVPAVAALVVFFALAGAFHMLRRDRSTLVTLTAAFAPYLVFDLLFQETATIRYALPLVAPMAFLAMRGLELAGRTPALVVAVMLAAFNAHVGGISIGAYAREKAPAFRMLDDMAAAAPDPSGPPTLAMDRRADLDLRRPIQWVGDRMPRVGHRLPAPPNHEWLEVVKHWNASASQSDAAVWFVADPLRTDIDLIQHADPQEYPWRLPYPILAGGTRPYEMRWHRLFRPDWYVGEGWALTPEAAGVADADGRGLSAGPIDAWVSRRIVGGVLVIGGRNLSASPSRITLEAEFYDGGPPSGPLAEFVASPGFFVRTIRLSNLDPPTPRSYVRLVIRASPPAPVKIEQFDAADALSSRSIFGYGNGWHEPEYNSQNGLRWRWLSERGELRYRFSGRSVRLHLEGESPRTYFSRPSRLVVRAGERVLLDRSLSTDFSIDAIIPAEAMDRVEENIVTVETDQVFIPAERGWRRTADRRHLGLRIFKCELRPVAPAS